jgi:hypothetical protein
MSNYYFEARGVYVNKAGEGLNHRGIREELSGIKYFIIPLKLSDYDRDKLIRYGRDVLIDGNLSKIIAKEITEKALGCGFDSYPITIIDEYLEKEIHFIPSDIVIISMDIWCSETKDDESKWYTIPHKSTGR